jgi:peptide/nickel transport system substrate-binding protein
MIGWLALILLLIILAGLQMILYGRNVTTFAPENGGTYAEGVVDTVTTLNPLFASSTTEKSLSRLLFSGLKNYDAKGLLQNELAESIVVADKGKQYIATLRSDLTWHDGTALTAHDVAFTVRLMKNPRTGYRDALSWRNVETVVKDDRTIIFNLKGSYAPFLSNLTFPIVPHHILKTVKPELLQESSFSQRPVGSGAFRYEGIQTIDITNGKSAIKLSSFNNYWSGQPILDNFIVYTYASQSDAVKGLRAHEVNAISDIDNNYSEALRREGYNAITIPLNSGVYALFNTTQPFLQDNTIRKALVISTDQSIIQKDMNGEILHGPLVADHLPLTAAQQQASYNLSSAHQLLAQAGWQKVGNKLIKDGKPLALTISAVDKSQYRRIADQLAQQWRKLGASISTQYIDADQIQQSTLKPRAYDILIYELEIGGDPDVTAYWHSLGRVDGGLNLSNYSSSIADDALTAARIKGDLTLRDGKYATFVREWLKDAPAVALYRPTLRYVTSTQVRSLDGNYILPTQADRFDTASLWSVGERLVYRTP